MFQCDPLIINLVRPFHLVLFFNKSLTLVRHRIFTSFIFITIVYDLKFTVHLSSSDCCQILGAEGVIQVSRADVVVTSKSLCLLA